ncbi:MAG: hypothetical protein K0R26_1239 [Bacteroidota bacterium]|jgi:LEA14-like dessication related protein|nr:hypothetical protein [Bacteroidota bacterium]
MNLRLFFLLLPLIVTSCKPIEELKVSNVESFNLTKITTKQLEGEIGIKVNNPNKMGFSIYPSEFAINFSGMNLGNARLYKKVRISGNSEKVYMFKLNTDLSTLNPMDMMKLATSGKSGNIEVKGNLKVGKFLLRRKIPVSYTDKVNLFR